MRDCPSRGSGADTDRAGTGLLLTVGVGIVAHGLSHAAVLHLLWIQCDIALGPDGAGTSRFGATVPRAWATVTLREASSDTPAYVMRLSAIAPLVLGVSFVTVPVGTVPDPLQADGPLLGAVTIGWLACALPSPQDFSVFWHADRSLSLASWCRQDPSGRSSARAARAQSSPVVNGVNVRTEI